MQRDRLLLTEMIDAAEQAQKLAQGVTVDELAADRQRRDALLWNFTVLGEAVGQLSADLKSRFPEVAWQQPARLRNRIVHGYWSIDMEIEARSPSGTATRGCGRRCPMCAHREDRPFRLLAGRRGTWCRRPGSSHSGTGRVNSQSWSGLTGFADCGPCGKSRRARPAAVGGRAWRGVSTFPKLAARERTWTTAACRCSAATRAAAACAACRWTLAQFGDRGGQGEQAAIQRGGYQGHVACDLAGQRDEACGGTERVAFGVGYGRKVRGRPDLGVGGVAQHAAAGGVRRDIQCVGDSPGGVGRRGRITMGAVTDGLGRSCGPTGGMRVDGAAFRSGEPGRSALSRCCA